MAKNKVKVEEKMDFFRRKRGGVLLTKAEVSEIKAGRKKLRRDLRAQGIKSKSEFEYIASGLGLYFDKRNWLILLLWIKRHWLGSLIGSTALLLTAFSAISLISQLRGHFTINMSSGLFEEGFVLSETEDFSNPTTSLFARPAVEVPCISGSWLPKNIGSDFEGQHNDYCFAYTFFIRNEGESVVNYAWEIALNSESQNMSNAAWVMVFEDEEMLFYAKPNLATGEPEYLPAKDDNKHGFLRFPTMEYCKEKDKQFSVIAEKDGLTYYRVIPKAFEGADVVSSGKIKNVKPKEVHRYTIVIWLEGDDPDCTVDLIGGHLGLDMQFALESENNALKGNGSFGNRVKSWWDALKWY